MSFKEEISILENMTFGLILGEKLGLYFVYKFFLEPGAFSDNQFCEIAVRITFLLYDLEC